jgi:hypothetical protein
MTATELELKTNRFTAKLADEDLDRLPAILEDILDAREIDRVRERHEELIPHEQVKALAGL